MVTYEGPCTMHKLSVLMVHFLLFQIMNQLTPYKLTPENIYCIYIYICYFPFNMILYWNTLAFTLKYFLKSSYWSCDVITYYFFLMGSLTWHIVGKAENQLIFSPLCWHSTHRWVKSGDVMKLVQLGQSSYVQEHEYISALQIHLLLWMNEL